ncbi:carboxymuconolactone decarboxylase family protein [Actinomadura sp. KC06]|uniref:carboxymuconolactone decarboxylase family protein n=1 Tax=Actinomadura sp. KC06 TaxID=2530369 RepID=UPI00140442A0|nr:carboxymuconolactone decarboxylase family protein [Actinomadura sp. KC06]
MNTRREPHGAPPASLASDDRRERGISVYAEILDVPESEVLATFSARVGLPFAEEQLQAAGGASWAHPALTGRDRDVAVITALTAQGVSGDRLATHLRQARQHGLGEDALTALMTLLASYLGYPRASLAMEAVQDLFNTDSPSTGSMRNSSSA